MRSPDQYALVSRMDIAQASLGTSKNPILGRIAALQILAIPTYCSGLRLALHPD
ncbi:hypothetical protein [Undibacterium parvum]|uniref:hypothetical protein n=1 Tax=Undibacterium parvum TaxID=401471 RepID=UPI001300556D|nr:hypothetical protein [Undibacterium parvum]